MRWLWPALLLAACSPPPPAPTHVAPSAAAKVARPAPPPRLAVGEVAEAVGLQLPFEAAAGDRYVAVVTSAATGRGAHDYRLELRPTNEGTSRMITDCSVGPVAPKLPQAAPPAADRAPKVGERRSFHLRRDAGALTVDAEAVAVGRHAIVWADVSKDHPAEMDAAFAEAFLGDFEAIILPRARLIFGAESDIDGDGRIALLFSPLTRDQAVAFFSGCDLHPSCPNSNQGEVLYLTPPNAIKPPYNTPRAIKEILAHELGHLLHHQQKVLKHPPRKDDPDSLYLHEGLGALAQDTTGFQAGNLYVTMAGLAKVDDTSLNPILTEGTPYDRERDGPLRGLAYLFVRWLYDRAGGDETAPGGDVIDQGGPTMIRDLLGAPGSVAATLLTGRDRARLQADFYAALAAPPGGAINRCFAFRPTTKDPVTGKQRGCDPYAKFHGQAMPGATTQELPGDGALASGGGELVTLTIDEPGPHTVELVIADEARPALRLLRVE